VQFRFGLRVQNARGEALACFDGLADRLDDIRLAALAHGCAFDVALLGWATANRTAHAHFGKNITAQAPLAQRKIALSLAIVGALAAPFIFRTYKANPRFEEFVPLTAEQRERTEATLQAIVTLGGRMNASPRMIG
jgi:hypothetical protein